jgi:hypothetical protein
MFQSKAGYIDARPLTANSSNTSCNARPDHTFGSEADFDHKKLHVCFALNSGHSPSRPQVQKYQRRHQYAFST